MVKIIYKEGLEGQNRIECIEGIEIDLLNGQKALVYPKYKNAELVEDGEEDKWTAESVNEIEALKQMDNNWATGALLKIGSPAAKHVSQFSSDGHGLFGVPTLLAALEVMDQKKDIDALAETIEGADLLEDFSACVWSCSRYNSFSGWVANGGAGFAGSNGILCYRCAAVPLVLLSNTKNRKEEYQCAIQEKD